MKVLNFGSLNIDMVYSVDHVVRPGETTASAELRYFCGGKGLNQSVALARAGMEVCHAGCVGADGGRLISLLRDNGVDTSLITESESPSGHAIIQVDRDGQNSILLFGGANMEITPEQIENAVGNFSAGGRLFLQNEINGISEIISAAHELELEIVFNPSPFGVEILSYPLENIDWFVVNETEAEELTGETEPEKILGAFSRKFPRASVLLTLGADGGGHFPRIFLRHARAIRRRTRAENCLGGFGCRGLAPGRIRVDTDARRSKEISRRARREPAVKL